jgi:hypothetical protein
MRPDPDDIDNAAAWSGSAGWTGKNVIDTI